MRPLTASLTASLLPALFLMACSDYDADLLASFRRAIPQKDAYTARTPQDVKTTALKALGDAATFPGFTVPIARGINRHLGGMLEILEAVVATEPTLYNSETNEFVWGPYDNGDTPQEGDQAYVYIRDHGEDTAEDFRYVYAFLRGMGNDVATMTPIIWGGTNPDPIVEDYGAGVTLWDFEANYAWEEANNPGHGPLTRGRFAALFARGAPDEATDFDELTWVVAAFRDFIPEDAATDAQPLDLDYLWGRVVAGDNHFDFLDFQFSANLDGSATLAPEDMGLHLAFYNSGVGRAEVLVQNGDLLSSLPGYQIEAVECWNTAIARTYLTLDAAPSDDGSTDPSFNIALEGEPGNCVFESLAGVPSLGDLDAGILAALDQVASHGVAAE